MRKKLLLALTLNMSFSAFSAGVFIDDGLRARTNQFPAVIKLGMYDNEILRDDLYLGNCSGTLISPTVILTAAHCVYDGFGKYIRSSKSGDPKGAVEAYSFRQPFSSPKSIKVKKQFLPANYSKTLQQIDQLRVLILTFGNSMTSMELNFALGKLADLVALSSSNDLAFMVLSKPQSISAGKFARLGCEDLAAGTDVMLAGFGANAAVSGTNRSAEMYYGFNRTVESPFTPHIYELRLQQGSQLANKGDSGGPLFRRNDQRTVYGVVSIGELIGGRALTNMYASTASPAAKTFYRQIRADRKAPAELKRLVGRCL